MSEEEGRERPMQGYAQVERWRLRVGMHVRVCTQGKWTCHALFTSTSLLLALWKTNLPSIMPTSHNFAKHFLNKRFARHARQIRLRGVHAHTRWSRSYPRYDESYGPLVSALLGLLSHKQQKNRHCSRANTNRPTCYTSTDCARAILIFTLVHLIYFTVPSYDMWIGEI